MTPSRALLLLMLAILLTCGRPVFTQQALGFHSEELTYESRGIHVHSTLVRPDADGDVPVVLMAHGHGGTRDEAGGFRRLAEQLARRGIASLRMDFSGCGESVESFLSNNLTNMIADLRAGLEFVRSLPGIDSRRVGVVGYSMGARIAMLSLDDGYSAAVLWAPAGTNGPGALFNLFGGSSVYRQLRSEAYRNRFADFFTPWGQQQRLSCNWFSAIERSKPLEAIGNYGGPVLVIHGDADPIIASSVAQSVVAAATTSIDVRLEFIPGGDHGLGFHGGDPAHGDRVIEMTADFLVSNLFQRGRSPDAAF